MSTLEVIFESLGGHRTVMPPLQAILRVLAAALFTLITFELHDQFAGQEGTRTATWLV